ncbi:glutathione synthase [Fimicolochytrium jonesii]|uniref:glutathione synthase n=1 Tax=Fimicolochytrium jonesii TaxID=1396493 RepID=UPI0022FF109C|nr:glutathione synthase [Fimicolochytrium jonesii]KAI8817461.1 glutathione synthase [Fimicolochytrium jonesii]
MTTKPQYTALPSTLSDADLADLRDHAVDWALAHGLVIRAPPTSTTPTSNIPLTTHAPFALFPSPFPRKAFEFAVKIQPLFNQLVESVARDRGFLEETMESLSKVDDFTGRLYAIYKHVNSEGIQQSISLGLHRSDYLLHLSSDSSQEATPQQVELNTIASSFSSLSHLTHDLHKYLIDRTRTLLDKDPSSRSITSEAIPPNASLYSIARGIGKAAELYNVPNAIAVMIVQPGERNAFDQRWIEYTLFNEFKVKLVRLSLADVAKRAKLEGVDRRLVIDGEEVAVVYFRAAYTPVDYPSEKEWEARLLIERSNAIKCPNIAHHLVGTKKVQQILAKPGLLERFLKSQEECDLLRSSFTNLYPLDDTQEGNAAAAMALETPERFVMKPQREGGGNNLYGPDIPTALRSMSLHERNAYILMDLIQPSHIASVTVRHGEIIRGELISELGIYGVWISDGDKVHVNEQGGYLLRTKFANSNEGGVAAGFAVLDSPLLVD